MKPTNVRIIVYVGLVVALVLFVYHGLVVP